MRVAGVVLAAGAGRRLGGPKALVCSEDGRTFVQRAGELLIDSGCSPVLVTTGARARDVEAHLPAGAHAVHVPEWQSGPGAGLARVLRHPELDHVDALLITLVDLPHVTGRGVGDVLARAHRNAVVRAVERGRPGHPVLIGRDHFAAAARLSRDGRGLKDLLATASTVRVEVTGATRDVDRAGDLPAGARLPAALPPPPRGRARRHAPK
ncbi:nucleotidyltransferase family protein [Kineococcus sp. SYSU DK003]|uniref:nucleotidyltransferase family protein n=1 Tax=Kineococcus sp. SYSU DK003 TaxID=3383124 RepID=UPI003D7E7374